MKKKVVTLALTVVMALSVFPMVGQASAIEEPVEVSQEVMTPRAEQRMYYYRIHNGVNQYRVWSITYNKWLTDWTNC